MAVFHHPHLLARQQPDTDPVTAARELVSGLDELGRAAACAAAQVEVEEAGADRRRANVRREGEEIVFSPGSEVATLAWCLNVFASAVVDLDGAQAAIARGALAYAASAWSREIGEANGALER